MRTLVVDASIAIKWVVDEDGSEDALLLRQGYRLIAPDLLMAECANILWKEVRHEMTPEAGDLEAGLLARSDVELKPMKNLTRASTRMAIELSHPAYDCVYLALAMAYGCAFVTADLHLVRKVRLRAEQPFSSCIVAVAELRSLN